MHKLAKGLKKKKKQKKGKKGAEEEEFDPEELERYRRERAEAQQKAEESGEQSSNAGSDEWKKFQALTAGVDSILKKSQGDLDRIKSTSFFQRKPPVEDNRKKKDENDDSQEESGKKGSKKWVGFDEEGNPIEGEPPDFEGKSKVKEEKPLVSEGGFVEIAEDDDEQEDSADEDIFDTTYVDVLQNIDVKLAYIPDSPTEEETGDDPFDTTSADKVLKTVDKKGNKLVSLGNAVEVLAGRVDYVSSCKISRGRRPKVQQDLLLDDFDEAELPTTEQPSAEPVTVEKTLLDDDSDLPDIPIDLTKLPPVLPLPVTSSPAAEAAAEVQPSNEPLDISSFETLREKNILEEIPDLDDAEFDLTTLPEEPTKLEEAEDPFGTKEPESLVFQTEIVEASFEAATFVDEEDPFDTTFAENILPGKTELKFIEKELKELPVSEVTISLTDPAGLNRDYETGLLSESHAATSLQPKVDLLGGSNSDLTQLADQPIAPVEEITYVDPFDTSSVQELPPGRTELKILEKEILGEKEEPSSVLEDDDFDPRKEEQQQVPVVSRAPPRPTVQPVFKVEFEEDPKEDPAAAQLAGRRTSRPEVLELAPAKAVAFDLPTPSKRPDLLQTSEEEKALPSKPLTPYYSQKSIEGPLPIEEEEVDVDPFDTSFVAKVAPGKTELKLLESELLKQESKLSHSTSDHDFTSQKVESDFGRRQSDFTGSSIKPEQLNFQEAQECVLQKYKEPWSRQPLQKQESLLDAEVNVDAKALTPTIESKYEDEGISYEDPFDTSIATNILPGKAELKILESELKQIKEDVPARPTSLNLTAIIANMVPEIDDFNPCEEETKEAQDFLCKPDQDTGAKSLTPLKTEAFEEDADPFDTSFADIGHGKAELKQIESEMMKR